LDIIKNLIIRKVSIKYLIFNGTGAINFANYGYNPPLTQGELSGCIKANSVNGMGIYAFNTNPLRIHRPRAEQNLSYGGHNKETILF